MITFLYHFFWGICVVLVAGVWLCDPTDCSPPGSSVHGIVQARILEWIAISFSRGSSWPRDQTQVSCIAGRFFTIWAIGKSQYLLTITLFVLFLILNFLWQFVCCCCSVAELCPTPCNPMDCSTSGSSVLHNFPEFAQIHVYWVGDAIQPSHPLSSPSPPALNLSQQQGLFQWVGSSHQVGKVLKLLL